MTSVAVLTTTFYYSRNSLRFHLACQMIGNAIGSGHEVMVVDGSPDVSVPAAFARLGATVLREQQSGIGPSRRQLFRQANSLKGSSVFVWTEPEKPDLIRSIPILAGPVLEGSAAIAIMERTDESWKSYPDAQVKSEKEANAVYREVVGKRWDPMAGPVAWKREANSFFCDCYPANYGAADTYIQHIAPLEAMVAKFRVVSVPIYFFYPQAQRVEEEGNLSDSMIAKREKQKIECSKAYRLAAQALKLKP